MTNLSKITFLSVLTLIYIAQVGAFFALQVQTDSPTFANAIALWAGDDAAPDRLMRLSKPLGLLFPLLLYKLGFSAYAALLIQQHLALALALFFLYKIAVHLSRSVLLAQLVCILYAGCGAVGVYGLAVLVDMWAWATMLGLMCWSLWVYTGKNVSYAQLFSLGIGLGLGFFVKENVVVSGIFLFLMIIFSPNYLLRTKFFQLCAVGLAFCATLSLGLFLTSHFWGYNLYDWIIFNKINAVVYESPLKAFITQTFRSLDVGWWLVLLGIIQIMRIKNGLNPTERAFIITGFVGLCLFPLIWAYYMDRILFMFAPCWLYLAGWGLLRLGRKAYFLAFVAAFLNIIANFIVYNHPIAHFLPAVYAVYGFILMIFFIKKEKIC